MHPEINNNTKTYYLTLAEKSKATTKPWFSRLLQHSARKLSGSILEDTHIMLTYLRAPDPHGYHPHRENFTVSITNGRQPSVGIDYEKHGACRDTTSLKARTTARSRARIDRQRRVPLVRAISENYGDCRLPSI